MKIPKLISDISLNKLKRIDAGLEGNWNPSVVTIWTRNEGLIGYDRLKDLVEINADKNPDQIIQKILDDLFLFCGEKVSDDDFTILILKFK